MPALIECPDCKLRIQKGDNPRGLAWHDCRSGAPASILALLRSTEPLDTAVATDALCRLILERSMVEGTPVAQLAVALKSLQSKGGGLGGPVGGADAEIARWLGGAQLS
jgi:hypothetical protein